ncbi:DUF1330 domain-containing protein [Sandarakinorhabdus rubra]|uniref:DUF1330 domain-containing protein n=1 Tax=Sandarakinorhabdus rubra TaxID=2672568 RepID=UPI0013DC0642|nr:DUF1330 domain-containing protein [Sandarakinorhabdus rubra]
MAIPTHANHNPAIDPTREQVRRLRDTGRDGPVVMMNLLKFHETAKYPPELGMAPCTGEEAYARYEQAFTVAVGDVSQAEVLYGGPCEQVFIGAADAPEGEWDRLLLVRYPSRQHFLAMMADDRYRDALVHRYAALERTVLIQCG